MTYFCDFCHNWINRSQDRKAETKYEIDGTQKIVYYHKGCVKEKIKSELNARLCKEHQIIKPCWKCYHKTKTENEIKTFNRARDRSRRYRAVKKQVPEMIKNLPEWARKIIEGIK